MHYFWKIVLVLSLILNILAIWGFFHYVKYGGSPLGDLKRLLTGSSHQKAAKIPYAEDNRKIIEELKNDTTSAKRVVFLGASITRRWNLDAYFPEITAVNRGIGGQYVPQLMMRFKRDVIELKPDAVVIKFCSINIRPQMPLKTMYDGMEMMVQLARDNNITPIVCTVIPPAKPEGRISDFSVLDSVKIFNDWVRQYSSDNDLPLIDYARAIEDENGYLPRKYAADPVHVNEDGYEILSKTARPVINRVLKLD